jgi:hypothetical protein
VVFVREIDDRELTFGISGLLYKSNLLMYDHQTESLWLQVKRRAVTGPMTGAKLKRLPSTVTSWEKWRKRNPQTKVLSLKTGHVRDYSKDPYADYYQSRKGLFSFLKPGPGAKEKELVIGVELEGKANAYRGRSISLVYDKETDTVTVQDETGKTIDHMATYWMVWKGIYPETVLYGH